MSKTIFDRILTADYHDYHMCIYFYASIGIVEYVVPNSNLRKTISIYKNYKLRLIYIYTSNQEILN